MPLNSPKTYTFLPRPVGPVLLKARSSRRGRLVAGGTYFRSKERGESANLIQVTLVEDTSGPDASLVVQHCALKSDEMVFGGADQIELYQLSLKWYEEICIKTIDGTVRGQIYSIRWRLRNRGVQGVPLAGQDLGIIPVGRVFTVPGVVSLKLKSLTADSVIFIRPRTHWYTLVMHSVTDPTTSVSTIGWDTGALRDTVNTQDTWIRMPVRGSSGTGDPPGPSSPGEDAQDAGFDENFCTAFSTTNLSGGDGLPMTPLGFNTGPTRVLLRLNYGERDDGSLNELNEVYEWVGETALRGSWQRYS